MEEYTYYRFNVGDVILRKKGNLIEKKGKSGVWEEAPQLRRRFLYGDTDLTEIPAQEGEK